MTIIAKNRNARFNYQILEKFETGIELTGTEIKSLRANRVAISEAYVTVRNNELFLVNSHIPEYEQANRFNHTPKRSRKLLAHRSEITRMAAATQRHGLTLVPLSLYFKGRWAKLEVGVCRGKAKKDKRNENAKREAQREIARSLKGM
jgi:SsrA-binding protein